MTGEDISTALIGPTGKQVHPSEGERNATKELAKSGSNCVALHHTLNLL
jgi:hypothetical protein